MAADALTVEAMRAHLAVMEKEKSGSFTPKELQRFSDAVGEKDFQGLLQDYMKELSDPGNRAEMERMISSAEGGAPGSGGGVAGLEVPAGKQILKPRPLCTLEASKREGGGKVYVSLVVHADIAPFTQDGVTGELRLPCVTGPVNLEHDLEAVARAKGVYQGLPAVVPTVEVCFCEASLAGAPAATLRAAERTALEQADARLWTMERKGGASEAAQQPRGKKGAALRVLEEDYVVAKRGGVASSIGEARALLVALDSGLVVKQRAKGSASGASGSASGAKAAPAAAAAAPAAATPAAPAKVASVIKGRTSSSSSSSGSSGAAAATGAASAAAAAAAPPAPPAGPRTLTPPHTVVERSPFSLTDSHLGLQRSSATLLVAPPTRRPQELEVRVTLPGVASAAALEVMVSEDCRELHVCTPEAFPAADGGGLAVYRLKLRLSYAVHSDSARVKFTPSSGVLRVSLMVVQAAEPARARVAAAGEGGEEGEGQGELKLPAGRGASSASGSPLVSVLESVDAAPGEAAGGAAGAAAALPAAASAAAAHSTWVKGRVQATREADAAAAAPAAAPAAPAPAAPTSAPTAAPEGTGDFDPASIPDESMGHEYVSECSSVAELRAIAQAVRQRYPGQFADLLDTVKARIASLAAAAPAPAAAAPAVVAPAPAPAVPAPAPAPAAKAAPAPAPTPAPAPAAPAAAALPPYRWRQTSSVVTILFDVPDVASDSVRLAFASPTHLSLRFADKRGTAYCLEGALWGSVQASSPLTRHSSLDVNFVLVMAKGEEGVHWEDLLGGGGSGGAPPAAAAAGAAAAGAAEKGAPAPTSPSSAAASAPAPAPAAAAAKKVAAPAHLLFGLD